LFATSTVLSVCLPQRLFRSNEKSVEQSTMAITLCLSLSLFGLSILDATPDTWLLVLTHDDGTKDGAPMTSHLFTITRVYWMTLWALCLFLLVGLPCVTGAAAAQGIATWLDCTLSRMQNEYHDDHRSKKHPFLFIWRKCPWWTKIICQLCKIAITKLIRAIRKHCGLRNDASTSAATELPILASVNKDDELKRTGSSSDLERRPLMTSALSTTTTMMAASTTIGGGSHSNIPLLSNHRNVLVLGCVAATGSTIVVVSSIGPLVVQASSHTGFLSVAVSWLSAIGLMVSALLNGFGSVSMPYSCLVGLYLEPIRSETITKAEAELQSVVAALQAKRSDIQKLTFNLKGHHSKSASSSSNSTKMTTIMTTFSDLGDELIQRRQVLQNEIDFLVMLCKDMQEDIFEMRQSQAMVVDARTTAGKTRSWLGVVFSVILLIRLISAGVNILHLHIPRSSSSSYHAHHGSGKQHRSRGDLITTCLLWLTGNKLVDQHYFTMLSQFVSLLLTAVLAFTQIRTFLQTVTSVNRRMNRFYKGFSKTPKAGDEPSLSISPTSGPLSMSSSGEDFFSFSGTSELIYNHMLASIMGCYFLSCVVLIKMMLPEEYSAGFSGALGGLDLFAIHARVVNSAYAFSALVTTAILGFLFAIQRQNAIRHRSSEKQLRGAEAC
jgi:hypothetical protein